MGTIGDVEDWRVVELLTPNGYIVAVIYDDGVSVLASFDLEDVTATATS